MPEQNLPLSNRLGRHPREPPTRLRADVSTAPVSVRPFVCTDNQTLILIR